MRSIPINDGILSGVSLKSSLKSFKISSKPKLVEGEDELEDRHKSLGKIRYNGF